METQIMHMTEGIDPVMIRQAGEILKAGGLVAFPTETVYGLGGDALNPDSSRKIYAAKGRPSDNPLIVHICRLGDLETIAADIPQAAFTLAEHFWPGPLTMILRRKDIVPRETTGGLDTVAVRFPSHPIAMELIRAGGGFIAAPSANISGRPSPTLPSHVVEDLSGRVDVIIDGGTVGIGLESTIIDLTAAEPVILRPGYITQEMLSALFFNVKIDPGLLSDDSSVRPKAPGMKYRHYAPKAELTIVEGSDDAVTAYINEQIRLLAAEGKKTGVLCTDENRSRYCGGIIQSAGSRQDERSIALHLYETLRIFDSLQADIIYAESLDTPVMGQAIMNRLIKAAGHRIIHV